MGNYGAKSHEIMKCEEHKEKSYSSALFV